MATSTLSATSADIAKASSGDLGSQACDLGGSATQAAQQERAGQSAGELGAPDKQSMESMFPGTAGQIQENGPLGYRCTQGVLFVKRSENPESQKILKLNRPVGVYIHATGYTWTGSAGGIWAELDASKGEMGWALVKGPGFGLKGPALMDASELRDATSVRVILVDQEPGILYESLVRRDMTIFELKKLVAGATALEQRYCCLIKDPPAKIPGTNDRLPADYVQELKDNTTLASNGCEDTTELYLMYVQDYPKGFLMPKALTTTKLP